MGLKIELLPNIVYLSRHIRPRRCPCLQHVRPVANKAKHHVSLRHSKRCHAKSSRKGHIARAHRLNKQAITKVKIGASQRIIAVSINVHKGSLRDINRNVRGSARYQNAGTRSTHAANLTMCRDDTVGVHRRALIQ